jgi:hypothetical protein
MRLRDRFKNELAFSRYLQGSSNFRTVVERKLGLKILKTSAKMAKEVRLYRRPHRLDFPIVGSGGLVDYRTTDGTIAFRTTEGYVDYRDPVVRAANENFLRVDLVLMCEDFKQSILVENQFGVSDLNHRKRLMEYYNSTMSETKPERDNWSWVFWIAEDFREQDIEWVREHGHPIATFKAWPKGNSVQFEFVCAPVRIDEISDLSSQPVKQRSLEEW